MCLSAVDFCVGLRVVGWVFSFLGVGCRGVRPYVCRCVFLDEFVDEEFLEYYCWLIFFFFCKCHFFSGVECFVFYELECSDGKVDENVFVWSNWAGEERVLIVYNNVYEWSVGYIRILCGVNVARGTE